MAMRVHDEIGREPSAAVAGETAAEVVRETAGQQQRTVAPPINGYFCWNCNVWVPAGTEHVCWR